MNPASSGTVFMETWSVMSTPSRTKIAERSRATRAVGEIPPTANLLQ
jgi:hypothetical protein